MVVRAIYEDGQLRLLDPVELAEGQQVSLEILPNNADIRAALGDLVISSVELESNVDENALQQKIDEAVYTKASVSDAILDEWDATHSICLC